MIRKLLVANRGEIARRIQRTCRDLGIVTVAVHSDADTGAAFVCEADEAVGLGGATPAESYLRIDAVVDAALAAGADAVHPGYGFLSESAPFARAVIAAGLTWVGPPPDAIEAMGSKLAARALMAGSGVPVLPGEDLTGVADLQAAADRVGWPVLVKASAGGGGRGMRVVRDPDQLVDAVAGARREAAGAFGDDTVFLERYVDEPRHVEIQIFGDTQGTLVHLFERDCSIQRRHQKIIEEAPSPGLTPHLREVMGAAAVAAGRAIGYVGAGTVEFIVAPTGDFFFLEVNTRLQVEHPVTEAVTGLDLVALQLAVAEGAPLPGTLAHLTIHGHAVEARVYAEDPLAGFLPSTGHLRRFEIAEGPGTGPVAAGSTVRVDSGFGSGDDVSINYDPLLAKVIAHGATRAEAVRRLASALRSARIHGVTTNRDLLVGILEHPEFTAGRIDTHFLDRHPPSSLVAVPDDDELRWYALAAALADQRARRLEATVWAEAPSGWRNNRHALQTRRYTTDGGDVIEVGYALGPGGRIEIGGMTTDVGIGQVTPWRVELVIDGVTRRFDVDGDGADVWVDSSRGAVHLGRPPRFADPLEARAAGSLVAPMPGVVVRIDISEGDRIVRGQSLLVLEAMKMEHTVSAPLHGLVSAVNAKVGLAVDAGAVLVVIDGDDDQPPPGSQSGRPEGGG